MKEDPCLYAGGASRRGRPAPSRSQRLLREVLTCGGALLALYGPFAVQALSGFTDTGNIGFFANPLAQEDAKFYCDWRFDPVISPSLPACAQHAPELVAVEVPQGGFNLGLETDTTISSTRFWAITTSTKDVGEEESAARVALICETAGDSTGLNHCLRITEDPEDSGDSGGSCGGNPKFVSITRNETQCDADLAKLQGVFGATAHIDFTKDRNDADETNSTLNVNICTPASWVCGAQPSILTGLGNREIQQIDGSGIDTPHTCKIGGETVNFNPPPTLPHEGCP